MMIFRNALLLCITCAYCPLIVSGANSSRPEEQLYAPVSTLDVDAVDAMVAPAVDTVERATEELYKCIGSLCQGALHESEIINHCGVIEHILKTQPLSSDCLSTALVVYVTKARCLATEVIHSLIKHGANIHYKNDKLLIESVKRSKWWIFTYLLQQSDELKQPYRLLTFQRIKLFFLDSAHKEIQKSVTRNIERLSSTVFQFSLPTMIECITYELAPEDFVVEQVFVNNVLARLQSKQIETPMYDDLIGAILEELHSTSPDPIEYYI